MTYDELLLEITRFTVSANRREVAEDFYLTEIANLIEFYKGQSK